MLEDAIACIKLSVKVMLELVEPFCTIHSNFSLVWLAIDIAVSALLLASQLLRYTGVVKAIELSV